VFREVKEGEEDIEMKFRDEEDPLWLLLGIPLPFLQTRKLALVSFQGVYDEQQEDFRPLVDFLLQQNKA